jgi:hypothetical protein
MWEIIHDRPHLDPPPLPLVPELKQRMREDDRQDRPLSDLGMWEIRTNLPYVNLRRPEPSQRPKTIRGVEPYDCWLRDRDMWEVRDAEWAEEKR